MFFLIIYVDDLVKASNSIKKIIKLEGHFQKTFSIKFIGDIDYVAGLKVKRDMECKKLKLSEEKYARKVLERFGITDCCLITCPITPSATLDIHKQPDTHILYSQAIELVMYLAKVSQSFLNHLSLQ